MNKVFLTIGIGLLVSHFTAAQDDRTSSLNKDLVITKESKIELPEVSRNFEKITYDMAQSEISPQEYEFNEVPTQVAKLDMKVKIRTLNPDVLPKLYGNYVKAGFGNYVTPYLEGYFNSKRSDQYLYGLHVKHLSSSKGPVEFARSSVNNVDLYGKYFLDGVSVGANASYQRERFNYYGIDKNLENVKEDSLKLIYNTINAGLTFQSTNTQSELQFQAGLQYYNFGNKAQSENEVVVDLGTKYELDKTKNVLVSGLYSFSNRKVEESYSRSFFQLRPTVELKNEAYKIEGGLNFAYTSDTLLSSKAHLYPVLNANYYLIPNELTVYAGLGGGMQKNVLRTFAAQNPWILEGIVLSNTNKTFELLVGANGNTLNRLSYKAQLAYQTYKNLSFFVNDAVDTSGFNVIYDTGNSNILNFTGALSYAVTEKLRIGFEGNYYSYGLSTVEEAWHRPDLDLSILSAYNIYKKIYFNVDIFYLSGLKGQNPLNGDVEKLPGIVDLNLKLDYKFSEPFTAFIQLNNVLGQKYQRYLYYPVKGINVLAGVTLSF
jgi:hypothetical protein